MKVLKQGGIVRVLPNLCSCRVARRPEQGAWEEILGLTQEMWSCCLYSQPFLLFSLAGYIQGNREKTLKWLWAHRREKDRQSFSELLSYQTCVCPSEEAPVGAVWKQGTWPSWMVQCWGANIGTGEFMTRLLSLLWHRLSVWSQVNC